MDGASVWGEFLQERLAFVAHSTALMRSLAHLCLKDVIWTCDADLHSY